MMSIETGGLTGYKMGRKGQRRTCCTERKCGAVSDPFAPWRCGIAVLKAALKRLM